MGKEKHPVYEKDITEQKQGWILLETWDKNKKKIIEYHYCQFGFRGSQSSCV